MPLRRTDGFSDDGLSYSVATDFDKQLGEAMAEYDARRKDPRFVPGARVETPDAPDLLQRELIDPILSVQRAYQGMSPGVSRREAAAKPILPQVVKSGKDVFNRDPFTGQLTIAHQAPDDRLTNFKLKSLESEANSLKSTLADPFKRNALGAAGQAQAQARLAAIDQEAASILSPPAQPVVAPQSLVQGSSFIGTPGGTNTLTGTANAGPVKPGQVGPNEVVKPLKNGRKAVFDVGTKQFIRYAD